MPIKSLIDIDRTCVGGDRWKNVIPDLLQFCATSIPASANVGFFFGLELPKHGQIYVFIPPGLVLT
jgi:hypothetical protein